MPRLSLKQFFLPQNEDLFSWKQRGVEVEITEAPTTVQRPRRPRRQALRRRRARDRRRGHELGLRRRALERPPRGDDDLRARLRRRGPALLLHVGRRDARLDEGRRRPAHAGRRRLPRRDRRPTRARAFVEAHRARFADAAGRRRRRPAPPSAPPPSTRSRENFADRRRARPRLGRGPLRGPLLGHARRALQRLRRLHHGLPHLPLLRHRRRGRGRRLRHAAAAAGTPARRASSPCTPRATTRAATRSPATASASTTSSPIYPTQVRRGAVHRLRPLRARLPDGPEHRRDPGRDRRVRAADATAATSRRRGRGVRAQPAGEVGT